MHIRHGAARAAQLAVAGRGESKGGAPELVFQPRSHQADHPLMPFGVNTHTLAIHGRGARLRRRPAPASRMAVSIPRRSWFMRIQLARQFQRLAFVVGNQAVDAYAHVGQPSGGIDARAQGKAKVEGAGGWRNSRAATANKACMPGCIASGAHFLQALGDEHAIIGVQLDDIGNRTQRDEVGQVVQPRPAVGRVDAPLAQFGAQASIR